MSWLFATIYDPFMKRSERACLGAWRRELLSTLSGTVLEIGAGTGANLGFYPPSVDRLTLTDADEAMLKRLRRRHDAARAEIVHAQADALPFGDETFDAVVSTLVLCSVPDAARALNEIKRVLRPGGAFVFLEHVAAELGSRRLRWQRRVTPLWSRVAGNCHLTRETEAEIVHSGLTLESATKEDMRGALPVIGPTIRGVARRF